MKFWLAFFICSTGVAGLFFLDRNKTARNSIALWLPVMWLWIVGSRPVSTWFGEGVAGNLNSTLDGSPMDAAVFMALLALGLIVLFRRRKKATAFLKANGVVIVYFLYCLISVTWSPFHGPAFKRWIKAIGDLVMVLILVTDGQPIAALRRLYSRLGFILLPFSIVLIRYTDLGRGYDPDGNPMNTGVTTNKNSLGLIVFVIALGALWNVRTLFLDKKAPYRTRRLVAQGTLLTFGIVLLEMAHSATSVACFLLAGGLMVVSTLRAIRKRPGRVHALCMVVLVAGSLAFLFGGQSMVSTALGRSSTLSGRTDIWSASIAVADSPLIGTGFESFWNAHAITVARALQHRGFLYMPDLVSAHNGYLETYLDLGWVGVCLIALILITGYRHAIKTFRQNPNLGSLMLAYITTGAFYNITEAGFRILTPSWIFLLLAVVSSSGAVNGLLGGEAPKFASPRGDTAITKPAEKLIPEWQTV